MADELQKKSAKNSPFLPWDYHWIWYKSDKLLTKPKWVSSRTEATYKKLLGSGAHFYSLFCFATRPENGLPLPAHMGPLCLRMSISDHSSIRTVAEELVPVLRKLCVQPDDLKYAFRGKDIDIFIAPGAFWPKGFATNKTIEVYNNFVAQLCAYLGLENITNIYDSNNIYDYFTFIDASFVRVEIIDPQIKELINAYLEYMPIWYEHNSQFALWNILSKSLLKHDEHKNSDLLRNLFLRFLPKPQGDLSENVDQTALEKIRYLQTLCPTFEFMVENKSDHDIKQGLISIAKMLPGQTESLLHAISPDEYSWASYEKTSCTCSSLKTIKDCQRDCGVLSPVELLHETPSFQQTPTGIQVGDTRLSSGAAGQIWHFPPNFSQACRAIMGEVDESSNGPAVLFMLSALAAICRDKIRFRPNDSSILPMCFFTAVLSEGENDSLGRLQKIAFSPVLDTENYLQEQHDQAYPNSDEQRKALLQKLRQLQARKKRGKWSLQAQQDEEQADKMLGQIFAYPPAPSLFARKFSPLKFYEDLALHPECSVVFDSTGEFWAGLLSNSKGQIDKLRLLDNFRRGRSTSIKSTFGTRPVVKPRPFVISSIMSRGLVAKLFNKKLQGNSPLLDDVFLVPRDLSFLLDSVSSTGSSKVYLDRMAELSNLVRDIPDEKRFDIPGKASVEVLAGLIGVLVNFYETGSLSWSTEAFFLKRYSLIAETILKAQKRLLESMNCTPEAQVAARIRRYLLKQARPYFRLREVQNALGNVRPKKNVEIGLQYLVECGEVARVFPECKLPGRSGTGQLYMVNMQRINSNKGSRLPLDREQF